MIMHLTETVEIMHLIRDTLADTAAQLRVINATLEQLNRD